MEQKFLITRKSENVITGSMMVTTSPRSSCPTSCPLRKGGDDYRAGACYAENGFLGAYIWTMLDRTPVSGSFRKGRIVVRSLDDLTTAIREQPEGAIWRHNQAGDLAMDEYGAIDAEGLSEIVRANQGRCGFTFTHHDVLTHDGNREAVASANRNGFTINLSGNSLDHADELADLEIGPVTAVVEARQLDNLETPKGRKVVICPARRKEGVTCKTCRLCQRQRDFIIGFPATGRKADRLG